MACCRPTRAGATSFAASCAAPCATRICSARSEPLMYRLVPALVAEMGAAYPELVRAQPLIEATLQQEETRFRQTLVERPEAARMKRRGDLAEGGTLARRNGVQALRHLRLPLRPDRGRAARPRAAGRSRGFRRRHGRAEGRGPRCLEGLGRQGAPTKSGSTSSRSMERPSSPAIRATKARASCLRSSRTEARRARRNRRDGRHPAQPDAVLRRKRRSERATPEN